MPVELSKLTRKRATDEVYEAIRHAILTDGFKPGERLQVEEICTKLGVSLTPVRHAIQQLSVEGLIEIHPRSGTYVARLSTQDVEETFDIRCALECLAAESAVKLIAQEQIDAIKKILKMLSEPVKTENDVKRHEGLNSEFHQILLDASGNRRLTEMYHGLNAHLKIARIHGSEGPRANWPQRLHEEQAEHMAILEALEARDLERLTAALRKHIHRAKETLVSSLRAAATA
jgi:DNA-binding GntR family transcriptional regulator